MSDISLAPFVEAITPILGPVAVAGVGTMAGWFLTQASRWVGAKHANELDQGQRAALQSAAKREAQVLIAAAADNLANRSISVHSPGIAQAAAIIAKDLPGALKRLGITPDAVERLVVAEIGAWQASMTQVHTPATAPAAAPDLVPSRTENKQ